MCRKLCLLCRRRPQQRQQRHSIYSNQVSEKLISVIGDEDTCVGFLMSGIGNVDNDHQPTLMVVREDTPAEAIKKCFTEFTERDDVAVIMINQHIADKIRNVVDAHVRSVPVVVEISSENHPYDPDQDSILKYAKQMFEQDR
ncbi:hypothetical protein MTP99_012727 [Tenebrio molitor]|nr:hypothetical protein MTP99_012727 [Tenebrio molitor]